MRQVSHITLHIAHYHGITEDELLIEIKRRIEKLGRLTVVESEFISKELTGSPSPNVNKYIKEAGEKE